jgi:hypothetical protein
MAIARISTICATRPAILSRMEREAFTSNRPYRRIARLATKTPFASLEVEKILNRSAFAQMKIHSAVACIAHCQAGMENTSRTIA